MAVQSEFYNLLSIKTSHRPVQTPREGIQAPLLTVRRERKHKEKRNDWGHIWALFPRETYQAWELLTPREESKLPLRFPGPGLAFFAQTSDFSPQSYQESPAKTPKAILEA